MTFKSEQDYKYHMRNREDGVPTVVAFIAGLIVGGLLLWVFAGDSTPRPHVKDANELAIDACIDQGGVPILGTYEKITDCKKI